MRDDEQTTMLKKRNTESYAILLGILGSFYSLNFEHR